MQLGVNPEEILRRVSNVELKEAFEEPGVVPKRVESMSAKPRRVADEQQATGHKAG